MIDTDDSFRREPHSYKGAPPWPPINHSLTLASDWLTSSPPVTLAEIKTAVRVDTNDDDAYLTGLLTAATQYCQQVSNTVIAKSSVKATWTKFPPSGVRALGLPWGDTAGTFTSTIEYYTDDDVYVALASGTDYYHAGNIAYRDGEDWPQDFSVTNPLPITLTGTLTPSENADQVAVAIMMLVGHWYSHRSAVCDSRLAEVPMGVNMLLQNNTFYGGLT